MISIIFPLIVTALGIAYLFSPINFATLFFGPFSFADDILVGIIIFLSWVIFFAAPLLEMVFNVIAAILVIGGLIWVTNWLWRKAK